MPSIPYVENPRRRRRHKLTAKQLAYGFGGKRHRRSRRKNPGLAVLSGFANPRRHRRRRHHGGFSVRHIVRRRNPGMFGGLTGFLDFKGAMYVAGGIIVAKIGPTLIRKVWAGAPQDGVSLYAMQAGSAILGAMAVKMVLKNNTAAQQVAVGGLGYTLYQVANEYLLPKIGLAGIGDTGRYVTVNEVQQVSGYQPAPTRMAGYQPAATLPELSL